MSDSASNPIPEDHKQYPGRVYYAKRLGFMKWRVFFSHNDGSTDVESGRFEWEASPIYFLKCTAENTAGELWRAFNDGVYIESCRSVVRQRVIDAAKVKSPPKRARGVKTIAVQVGDG